MSKTHPAANNDGVLSSNDPVGRRIYLDSTPRPRLTQASGIRRYCLSANLLVEKILRRDEEVRNV